MPSPSVTAPKVFETVQDFKTWRKQATGSVGFVATMGALHEGHLSLIKRARQLNDNLVVSIFVNPLQFGPKEDFGTYPRTFAEDLEHCQSLGVDAVFAPTVEELYPEGKDACTKVIPPPHLADVLEGSFRPGFFTGVATVVSKLFNVIEPDLTIFGEKDYQQLLIVKRLVGDLNIPVTVQNGPIIRAADGLALSSRNSYLSESERKIAPKIQEILAATAKAIKQAPKEVLAAIESAKKSFAATGAINLQYLEARDAETLEEMPEFDRKIVLLAAAKIGNVRLIDNALTHPIFPKRTQTI